MHCNKYLASLGSKHIAVCTTEQSCLNFIYSKTSWLHRASNNVETFLLPTDAHNVKKHRVIKTF